MQSAVLPFAALLAMVPAALLPYRREAKRDASFWLLLGVAISGPLVWAYVQMGPAWEAGLASALWVTVATTLLIFAVAAWVSAHAWRISVLLLPYLIVLGALAMVWQNLPLHRLAAGGAGSWFAIHIVVSVATYALLTLAAVAAAGVAIQEHALKRRRPSGLSRLLPSVADGERLQLRLLLATEIVLTGGLATGMAAEYRVSGSLLVFDHKIVLVLAAFAVIGLLLLAHWRSGVGGRRAARVVLLAYLLVTLGYPGVKFVTDVLLDRPATTEMPVSDTSR